MRIVFDLDGVICELKKPTESYSDVPPKKEVIKEMQSLKEHGHYLIIHTGRHMKTCNGDIAKVIERVGKITEDWLKKWEVPFDELVFGKPYADAYVDDLGIEFSTNEKLSKKLESKQPTIIIPMAGKGKRFKENRVLEPKYMINVKGKTLFEWSIESLPINISKKLIFVCLEEHEKKYNVSKFIENKIKSKDHHIVWIKQTTRGQVETVLKAKELVDPDDTLIIYNIDTYFVSTRLKSKILTVKNREIDGLLGCFASNDANLSYVECDKNELVKRVKEKEQISNFASTGLYVFSKAKEFFDASEEMIKKEIKVKDEFYVSEIYNMLLKLDKKFEIDVAEEFFALGTPDDIKNFKR